jgi:hypothetical protein
MNPLDTRKTIRSASRSCQQSDIEVIHVPSAGKGSHQGLVFHDRKTNQRLKVIFAGADSISPGVQRKILQRFTELSLNTNPNSSLAERLKRIFEKIFH